MKMQLVISGALILPMAAAWGQQTTPPPAPAPTQTITEQVPASDSPAGAPTFVLRTTTREVNLDVVVTDSKGHAVLGLKRDNFKILDEDQPQRLRGFSEHSGSKAIAAPEFKMPPNTFTNYVPPTNPDASFVILFDSLDTEMIYQAPAYIQARDFIKDLAPGTSVAIFDLNQRMSLVQGFTTDREVLLNALKDKRAQPKASPLLGTGNEMWRQQLLNEGMTTMGRYLTGFPGRKNLIWFVTNIPGSINERTASVTGGSEPGALAGAGAIGEPASAPVFDALQPTVGATAPDPRVSTTPGGQPNASTPVGTTINNAAANVATTTPSTPNAVTRNAFQDLTNLIEDESSTNDVLTLSKVVVYPVDPRELMMPAEIAAHPSYRAEQSAMENIADSTGGQAFTNRNNLTSIMKEIVSKGSDYYTLTYSPTSLKADGAFRKLKVLPIGEAPQPGHLRLETAELHLTYRPGYYAAKPPVARLTESSGFTPMGPGSDDFTLASELAAGPGAMAELPKENLQASMTMGQIPPTELVLNASVKPSPTSLKLAKGETPPDGDFMRDKFKRQPFRLYDVLFATDVGGLKLPRSPDGHHRGGVEFVAVVYTDQGDVVNSFRVNIALNLREDSYRTLLQNGMGTKHSIAIPVKGNYVIRLGVHDANSDRMGALEFPLSAVSMGVAGVGQTATP